MSDDEGVLLFQYRECTFRIGAGAAAAQGRLAALLPASRRPPRRARARDRLGRGPRRGARRSGGRARDRHRRPARVGRVHPRQRRPQRRHRGRAPRRRLRAGGGPRASISSARARRKCPPRPDASATTPRPPRDNGGPDGWALLDRLIREAPAHLGRGGRLPLHPLWLPRHRKRQGAAARRPGSTRSVRRPRDRTRFPRIGYEQLVDYLRALDPERTIPRDVLPRTVDRYVVAGSHRR